MACTCTATFGISKEPSVIYLLSQVTELCHKSSRFLDSIGIDSFSKPSMVIFNSSNPYLFFKTYHSQLSESFNEMERQEIKIYLKKEDEELDLSELINSCSLSLFINFFTDREFYDILNNESLTSYFQPIIDVKNRTIFGYEALVRGVKADGSLMYPDELFEKSGRDNTHFKLDRLCRESALKTAAVKKIKSHVFINFLPTTIYDPNFCLKSTVKWANQLEFDPQNIVFEVVETEKTIDKKHLRKILDFYRDQGYKIALDDLGEGYSTLNLLIELKPDFIKIDRGIITRIDQEPIKQSVYKALYSTAKENNISVLAEGVETKEELEYILSVGVDYAQGYYYGKPQAEPLRKPLH